MKKRSKVLILFLLLLIAYVAHILISTGFFRTVTPKFEGQILQEIKPDIVIKERETDKTFVIDTKWKVLKNNRPSDDDLKQMYVYNHHWNASHSVLLYPKSKEQKDVIGQFALPMSNQVHSCQLAFASVLKNGALNKDLANQVMDKLKY